MQVILWASAAFLVISAAYAVWRRIAARRHFETHRAEAEALSARHGIPVEEATRLIGLPPKEQASRAIQLHRENR
ncbi:MAG: hypothetical protein AB1942_01400 [Pseudomonadota bacterium]